MLGHGLTEFGIGHGYGYGLYGPYGPQPTMASTMSGPMMVGPIGQPIAAHMGHIGAPGMAPLMSLMGPVGPMPMMRHASHGVMPGQMLASGIGPINAPPAPHYLATPSSSSGWCYNNNGKYPSHSHDYKDSADSGESWWTWNKKKNKNKRTGTSGGSEPRWKKSRWSGHDDRYGHGRSPGEPSGGDGAYGGGGDGIKQDGPPGDSRDAIHGDDGGGGGSGDDGGSDGRHGQDNGGNGRHGGSTDTDGPGIRGGADGRGDGTFSPMPPPISTSVRPELSGIGQPPPPVAEDGSRQQTDAVDLEEKPHDRGCESSHHGLDRDSSGRGGGSDGP